MGELEKVKVAVAAKKLQAESELRAGKSSIFNRRGVARGVQ
jgi:hypothetical protein